MAQHNKQTASVGDRHAPSTGSVTPAVISLVLFVFALLPRAFTPARFLTIDEAYHWFSRAERFLQALQTADFAATNIVGHPGVTTMWLGASGVLLHRVLATMGVVPFDDPALHRALLRLPVAVVTSLAVALAYVPLRRLLGNRIAELACLLWASEPFIIAHSKLLHTDALLTSGMTLSLLTALVAFGYDEARADAVQIRRRWLIASGVAAGLAFLTKSPSIALVPSVGLIALLARRPVRRIDLRGIVLPLLLWIAVAAVVWFVLWPATWVDLPGAIGGVYHQAESDGGSPHGWGNFFLGRAIADPGPLFYLVAIPLRLTPWALVGLFVLLVVAVLRYRRLAKGRTLLVFALYIVLFVGMMSILPKKFDRYVLPVFPALDVLAAVGLVGLVDVVMRWLPRPRSASITRRNVAASGLAMLLLAGNLYLYHPYEIAYYSSLFGGGAGASRLIPVGWGEGYEEAGDYIKQHYNGCDRPVATWYGPALSPFVCGPVVGLDWALNPEQVGYAVLYVDQIQRGDEPEVTAALMDETPLHIVRIHGIDYAHIYQVLPQSNETVAATFGTVLGLSGYDVDLTTMRTTGVLTVRLSWQGNAPPENLSAFLHILGADGTRIGQADVPLIGPYAPVEAWQAGQTVSMSLPIPVQADAPPGPYWLAIGVYQADDFSRLPLTAPPTPDAPDDGPDALRLGPFEVK